MKQALDLIIVIPIGPNCQLDFIRDTVDSVRYYVHSNHRIIFADDSQQGMGARLQFIYPDTDLVTTRRSMGKLGGLYMTLSAAFRYAIGKYHFKALLRMDTDALIIGHDPEQAAISLFQNRPETGIAGQYPVDYHGIPWDNSWPGSQLYALTHTLQFFHRPLPHSTLMYYYIRARANGYQRGESVFGGACFYSESLLLKFEEKGLLPRKPLSRVNLEEDHLFSLLAKAVGFELGGLAGPDMPMACAWKGLPDSPERLLAVGKKIVHSTRFWNQLNESDIRKQFRTARVGSGISTVTAKTNFD